MRKSIEEVDSLMIGVLALIASGSSIAEAARSADLQPSTVHYRLKRPDPCNLAVTKSTRNFLAKGVRTEMHAYFLGLVITDGYLVERTPRANLPGLAKLVCITQGYKNCDVIFKLHRILGGAISKTSRGKAYNLFLRNAELHDTLVDMGIAHCKSAGGCDYHRLYECIPEHLLWAFFRGCVDGDGTVAFSSATKKALKLVRLCLYTCDKAMANWAALTFNGYVVSRPPRAHMFEDRIIEGKLEAYEAKITDRAAVPIINSLYPVDASIYVSWKYETARFIVDYYCCGSPS